MTAPDHAGSQQASSRSIMLVLAYLPPFAVIPLLVEKDPEIHWHAKHGIVLMAAEMLLLLGLVVVALLFGLLTAGIGCALLVLVPIPFLAFLVIHLVAVVKAFGGKRLVIPIVSEYADRF